MFVEFVELQEFDVWMVLFRDATGLTPLPHHLTICRQWGTTAELDRLNGQLPWRRAPIKRLQSRMVDS